MRIALVHDWLNQVGGAEDVLTELVSMFPQAPIYTSLYWREKMPAAWQQWPIRTLWTDRLPQIHQQHQRYLPLYPLAFGALDLSSYDVVLSNKSGFCHGVRTQRGARRALHICYCLAPTRYLWQYESYVARENLGGALKTALRPLIGALRRWDYAAAQRVDHFIAISTEIQARIKAFYKRDSTIIFPPVATERFTPVPHSALGNYYLVLSRLVPYKRVDLAVQACTRLGLPLLVGGSGRDRERLERMAGETVKFLGYVPESEVPQLMARCKALIFPGLEDFGIAPVQAQAAGRPVIAFRGGGTLDTVREGETGLFFDAPTVESLVATLKQFEESGMARTLDSQKIRQQALRFDRTVFQRELRAFIEAAYAQRRFASTLRA
ncbi:MAG: glycosyl transferase [Candidatus Thermofonsia Clade 1 bacterium]|uniref:Glycosyl transferase n=1 Tax=Candidatus Thermofonsia Clade 1 bacterium TaxID=2364210 RepID=A0A2M8Q0X4_9CHLR|nr:MAG: glycosyl transferase [Candidatus Thermofonsia Clade 1 bacterium]PJF43457.1 MAG: glycosyl transferase [Candidatus Thermofonsia Clade 1 bacterium]RMF50703.1 MAG: glycosyltransferase family 4 protein [Chloroflexota bacterium]